jgi:hypothetical protein
MCCADGRKPARNSAHPNKSKILKPETAMKFFDAVHGVNNPRSKLGRPKTIHEGMTLNLYVAKDVKQSCFKMATDEGKSISAIFTTVMMARVEEKQAKEALALARGTPPVNAIPAAGT